MPIASGIAATPRPLLIHAAGHACLAWWHVPAATALPLAVVMVSSWGEEDMSAYDGQRRLADALAEAGLGVLRFDGPDSGDSSASTGDADLADTFAALDAAATAARQLSGCERLAFRRPAARRAVRCARRAGA